MTPAPLGTPPSLDDTFTQLMGKASEKGDLPGFSQSSRSILNALTADADNDFELVQTVTTDAGLTQRVLRLANSAMYNVFGGEVNTISRAIQVLGVQTVAHLALGLKVIESVDRSRPDSAATLAEMQKAVLAGFVGRQFAGGRASLKDTETAVVCAVLMGLGRMMVCFYIPDAWVNIKALTDKGVPEDDATQSVLGGSFADVGQRMAAHWGLPATLTDGMRPLVPVPGQAPASHQEWLSMLATAACQGAQILHSQPDDTEVAFGGMVSVFSSSLGMAPDAMLSAIRAAKPAAQDHFDQAPAALTPAPTESERTASLLSGLSELEASSATASLMQLLTMALEFLHINFGAARSYAFLLTHKDKCYRARYGLGEGANARLPQLTLDQAFQPDVFHAVLKSEKVMFVPDTRAVNLKGKLPSWWLSALGDAHSICILPLHLNRTALGFLYVDWLSPAGAPRMDAQRLHILTRVRELLMQTMAKAPGRAPVS